MIDTKFKPDVDAFEDAVQATTFMATVHIRHGELTLPQRIREHLADGDVVVHLLRGEDDETRQTAKLTAGSKLVGIEWPADIRPHMSLTVLCPRGGASHDVGVLLPTLEQPLHFDNATLDEPEQDVADDGLCSTCAAPAIEDPYFTEQYCQRHLTEAYDADEDSEYDGPTDDGSWRRDDPEAEGDDEELDDEPLAASWPGDEDLAAADTSVIPAVEPGEQTELIPAVGTLPVRRAWLALAWFHAVAWFAALVDSVEVRIENVSQGAMDHARVIAKVFFAVLAALILVVTAYASLRGVA